MNEQLALFPSIPQTKGTEGQIDSSPTAFVGEPADSSPTKAVGEPNLLNISELTEFRLSRLGKGCLQKYLAPKNGKLYFRFAYRVKNRVKTAHIPGGNVTAKLAIQRADIIEQMIRRGAPTSEILNMIGAFKK